MASSTRYSPISSRAFSPSICSLAASGRGSDRGSAATAACAVGGYGLWPDIPAFCQSSLACPPPEDLRNLRIWPIILLTLGAVMEIIAIGLFVKEETEDKRRQIDFSKL